MPKQYSRDPGGYEVGCLLADWRWYRQRCRARGRRRTPPISSPGTGVATVSAPGGALDGGAAVQRSRLSINLTLFRYN